VIEWENGKRRYYQEIIKTTYLLVCCCFGMIIALSGCSSYYAYRAVNEDCNCEEYILHDGAIEYRFHAEYEMHDGVATTIEIELFNGSNEKLSLDLAEAKVSSRNIAYQYKDKFLPLPSLTVGPHSSDVVKLKGKEISGEDNWHEIAGERMTVTIKGLMLGQNILKEQNITFVPVNPKLKR
jgi:hypothetical protein